MTADRDIQVDQLVGLEVTQFVFDTSLHLFFGHMGKGEEQRGYDLSIAGIPFQVTGRDGETATVRFAPGSGDAPAGIDQLATLHLAAVATCGVHADGSLDLSFTNGMALHIGPDERSEAWALTSPAGTLASEPGGGLTRR